ncbi:aromatic amino acid transaminase [Neptuniibacter caesariensis]|uniref:Aspartate aminotransferase n=1 Tax=Neptuniibacter caesariensis TaxID=207954 RepID=A0A7U8C285_NEPCE|nr:aromatic amino acid transaminase [Neptuniibacter caesariensis]EAR60113.1 aspartate aminotransferase [Oceanospirillum sp. MED92] [Neptuniibacter caesariensis]
MLEHIDAELEDPILKVMASFKASTVSHKLDLGIGVYRDSKGKTPIFKAVKEAELIIQMQETSKAYLGPVGDTQYTGLIHQLLFGQLDCPPDFFQIIQTPGGTGALRVAGEFLHSALPFATLWLSDPAWSTHKPIFSGAQLPTKEYRYFDHETRVLDFAAMCEDIAAIPTGDIVLLQSCGHNPSGCNLSYEQWLSVSQLMADRGLLPLLDLAYHGLDQGQILDLQSIKAIEAHHDEWLLCYSASKTFSLYNDRTGALAVRNRTIQNAHHALSLILNLVCANYYMPPAHGASVVRTILTSSDLTELWKHELEAARTRIIDCRKALIDALSSSGTDDYQFLERQEGMFAYLGLTEKELAWLREKHALYFGPGGRLNIAGLNPQSLPQISQALTELAKKKRG